MHDSFPHSLELCRAGYTAFALICRPDDPYNDLARAIEYTGYSFVSEFDPPTYNCVGSNDGIASWQTMQNRLQRLSAMGIPTEFHVYKGLGHGFGIGTGTVAEGWVSDAIRFWEANMHADNSGIPPVYAD